MRRRRSRSSRAFVSVEADTVYQADTSTTPHFLGLDAKKGLWDQLGGPDAKANGKKDGAGENIIIGIIDSGITPESLSFTDQKIKKDKLGKVVYEQVPLGAPPAGWAGTCQTGEQWTAADCNNKLIGARYFNAGQGGNTGIDTNRPWEFNSPRDYNGHGTHTSSTSGGNFGVPATGAAAAFGKVSGMAPRARVAMYKALWSTQDSSTASGCSADLVAAINQAVADGVDVINYSISGTRTNFHDRVEIAFSTRPLRASSSPRRRATTARSCRPSPTRARGSRPSRLRRMTASAPVRPDRRHHVRGASLAPALRRASWSRSARRPRRPASAS